MREIPAYTLRPKLSKAKREILIRIWSDSACDARFERGRNSWWARRHAENCRMLAKEFGMRLSPEVQRQTRRTLDAARARRAERIAAGAK